MTEWICGRCYTRLTGEAAGVCPACGAEDVVPVASPRGQQMAAAAVATPAMAAPLPPLAEDVMVCPSCYAVARPSRSGPSSLAQFFLVLLMLGAFLIFWPVGLVLLLIIVIYSMQRTRTLCAKCGNEGVIPGNSERAQQILNGRR